MTKRFVSLPEETDDVVDSFIDEIDARLGSDEDPYDVVTDALVDLAGDRDAYDRWQAGGTVSTGQELRLRSYNPRNATLESEYYAEKDEEAFRESKALQWLWRQFDSLPIADNVDVALEFRQMLASHLFESCGTNCRFFKGITVTYGHNITVGDNTVIHDNVHLDDRGRLTIGDRVSISDGVHIYSHDHDVVDQTTVRNYHTIVEDDARLTFDAMIRAGSKVGENAIVGARAVVQQDVPAHHIVVGMPAKSVKVKPGWESVATPIADAGEAHQDRQLEFDADIEEPFDEFQRDFDIPEDRS